ncbi:MAG: hypothetical protein RI911_314 [Candidatus Parcubacteria bacterium]|jgi:hypothetical protein
MIQRYAWLFAGCLLFVLLYIGIPYLRTISLTNGSPKDAFLFLNGTRLSEQLTGSGAAYLQAAIHALKGTGISAALETTIGSENLEAAEQKITFNEVDFISQTTSALSKNQIPTHLLMHIVENRIPTAQNARTQNTLQNPMHLTAEEILNDTSMQNMFLGTFRTHVRAYTESVQKQGPSSCVITLFNDATPYRMFDNSGIFWLGSAYTQGAGVEENMEDHRTILPHPPQNGTNDMIFAKHFVGLYQLLRKEILMIEPSCSVGFYIQYSTALRTFNGTPLVRYILEAIPSHEYPNHLMIRLFNKSYRTQAEFEERAVRNLPLFRNTLKDTSKLYLVGQLHTTNEQGHGAGRTPSLRQLERTISLMRTLPIDAFGYLGKDIHPSSPVVETMVDTNLDGIEEKVWACEYYHHNHQHMKNTGCSPEEDSEPFAPNYFDGHHLLIIPDETSGLLRFEKGIELLQKVQEQ